MKNEREFTAEMMNKLKEADEAVKGTNDWMKYHMDCYNRSSQTNRFTNFLGFGVPYLTGTIKTFRGEMYIYTDDHCFGERRYSVSPEVKALLGLEVQA